MGSASVYSAVCRAAGRPPIPDPQASITRSNRCPAHPIAPAIDMPRLSTWPGIDDDAGTMPLPSHPTRDDLAAEYFAQLPFSPYPVQEDALLAWFTSAQGVLVCAPTGTGKTLIAEAAVYEALRTGQRMYYTTPLIALTEQKLDELRSSAVRWGFSADQIGLVTGNRRVNPDAPVLVVVAEILLNRLLNHQAFDFSQVSAVVMDEFHNFNDPERGIVWELSLGLLPKTVRTLLLSATVGNAVEFAGWLQRACQRQLTLVQGTERRVPLDFRWIGDELIGDWLEKMADGPMEARRTPALVFCFNRELCWTIAELLKGKKLVDSSQQQQLASALEQADLSTGAGPKLKALLQRGVGVHHAGVLPKYRRLVERLFQAKLLSVCVCTETLSAGINLPARSVVLPSLLTGPRDRKKLIEASSAHQIFGRAGRPQFDSQGYVFALAHEDDVKIQRWRERYDQIPEDTTDPQLRAYKKQMKKKMPTRRAGEQYWTQQQFEQLRTAKAAKLASRGPLPWRLLAYLLSQNAEVEPLRQLIDRRLLPAGELAQAQRDLNRMLVTLWKAGYVELEPRPKLAIPATPAAAAAGGAAATAVPAGLFGHLLPPTTGRARPGDDSGGADRSGRTGGAADDLASDESSDDDESTDIATATGPVGVLPGQVADSGFDLTGYRPRTATPTEHLARLMQLRSIQPLYGVFIADHLVIADDNERLQALESVLELATSLLSSVRVPPPEELPPGPLATERLHPLLLQMGLATAEELRGGASEEEDSTSESARGGYHRFKEPPPRPLTLAEKLHRLFLAEFPRVTELRVRPVWIAGEVLQFGSFAKYISAHQLQKHEGLLFRHLLRLVLLLDEMANLPPTESTPQEWEDRLDALADRLIRICGEVDPESTDEALVMAGTDELVGAGRRKSPSNGQLPAIHPP
jgi:superfamily II DNA/RNA helicase